MSTTKARYSMTLLLLIAAVAIALAAIVAASLFPREAISQTSSSTGPQKMAVPSYFYPGSLWAQMEQAVPTASIAIINPNSGPGSAANLDYVNQVKSSKAKGLTVLGYVHTSYGVSGERSLDVVKGEIDKYSEWYGVNNVFLDETSTDCSLASPASYYDELYKYIKAKGGTVVLNPGTQTNECYMSVGDIIINFEDTYNNYTSRYSAPTWVSKYSASRFWHLVHSTSNTRAMEKAVKLSKTRNAGYVYVTSDVMPNPWDTLPQGAYWSKEISALNAAT